MSRELLELAADVLAAQPFNDLVGAQITDLGDGVATLELTVADRHRQQFGLVHGGVYSYLADNVLTFAAGTVLGRNVVTGGFAINYVKATREGVLRAHARVTHHDRRHAVCNAEIHALRPDGTQTLCAIAQGTVFATRGGRHSPD